MPALVVARAYGLAGSMIGLSDPVSLDQAKAWADSYYPDAETIVIRSNVDEHGNPSPRYRGQRVMTRHQGRWTTP